MPAALGYDGVAMRRSPSVAAYTRAIRSLVWEHGFTQRMIARALGVSEAYISRLMRDPAKLEAFVSQLGRHPRLADFVRALEDREFRIRLQVELAFPELQEERKTTLTP
jgi:predicted transcriptional regulator